MTGDSFLTLTTRLALGAPPTHSNSFVEAGIDIVRSEYLVAFAAELAWILVLLNHVKRSGKTAAGWLELLGCITGDVGACSDCSRGICPEGGVVMGLIGVVGKRLGGGVDGEGYLDQIFRTDIPNTAPSDVELSLADQASSCTLPNTNKHSQNHRLGAIQKKD
ncbi:hypothetical protein HOY80DRAFT_1004482 [Tuber brumale]|nr:hypothetical protein HOY80DRAFT_1004482 [Tuber brumale]